MLVLKEIIKESEKVSALTVDKQDLNDGIKLTIKDTDTGAITHGIKDLNQVYGVVDYGSHYILRCITNIDLKGLSYMKWSYEYLSSIVFNAVGVEKKLVMSSHGIIAFGEHIPGSNVVVLRENYIYKPSGLYNSMVVRSGLSGYDDRIDTIFSFLYNIIATFPDLLRHDSVVVHSCRNTDSITYTFFITDELKTYLTKVYTLKKGDIL